MRTSSLLFSLSWRWLLSLALLLGTGGFLQQQLLFLDLSPDTRLQPSMFWCCLAGLNALISFVYRPGLMALLWGCRLLPPELWRRINLATSWLFLAMAVLALPIGLLANAAVWGFFKLYVQPFILLIWPACAMSLPKQWLRSGIP